MIKRNSIEPINKYDLYEQVKAEESINTSEQKQNQQIGQEENLNLQNIIDPKDENIDTRERKKIEFFFFQLIVSITIVIIFFSINTFMPKLYNDLINFFKEEVSIKTDFKEDAKNAISIIKSIIKD